MIELRELVEKLHTLKGLSNDELEVASEHEVNEYAASILYLLIHVEAIKNYLWEYQELQD